MGQVGEPEQGGGGLQPAAGAVRRRRLPDLRGEPAAERVVGQADLGGELLEIQAAGLVVAEPIGGTGDLGAEVEVGWLGRRGPARRGASRRSRGAGARRPAGRPAGCGARRAGPRRGARVAGSAGRGPRGCRDPPSDSSTTGAPPSSGEQLRRSRRPGSVPERRTISAARTRRSSSRSARRGPRRRGRTPRPRPGSRAPTRPSPAACAGITGSSSTTSPASTSRPSRVSGPSATVSRGCACPLTLRPPFRSCPRRFRTFPHRAGPMLVPSPTVHGPPSCRGVQ